MSDTDPPIAVTPAPGDVHVGRIVELADEPVELARIDIGHGVIGELRRSDLSWGRVGRISDELVVGNHIEVVVISCNPDGSRLRLGVKQLSTSPWAQFEQDHPPGTRLVARISGLRDYGAMVDLGPGMHGLLHRSELDWLVTNPNVADYVKAGEEIELQVLTIDSRARRIALGLKQCLPNPLEIHGRNLEPKGVLECTVVDKGDGGIDVDIDGGYTGHIAPSDLTYGHDWQEVMDAHAFGATLQAQVLDIDYPARHVRLGLKQLVGNPYEEFERMCHEREEVKGTVMEMTASRVWVDLGGGIEATLPAVDLPAEAQGDPHGFLEVGQEIVALISSVNKGKRKINLTMRMYEEPAAPAPGAAGDPDLPPLEAYMDDSRPGGGGRRGRPDTVTWAQLEAAKGNSTWMDGTISTRIKGGYQVDLDCGVKAFLPGSLACLYQSELGDSDLVGEGGSFAVISLDRPSWSITVNRRLPLERALLAYDPATCGLRVGDQVGGTVVGINDHPEGVAFVRLANGNHARLRRDDLSWQRMYKLSDELAVGAAVQARIMEMAPGTGIWLDAKRGPNPWAAFAANHAAGTQVSGQIVHISDEHGLFINLPGGVVGLVHKSCIPSGHTWDTYAATLHEGQEIAVFVNGVDAAHRRIELVLEQGKPNPWQAFAQAHQAGERLRGVVVNAHERLGLFVNLPGEVTGLVHRSNLTSDGRRPWKAQFRPGAEIDVYLIAVEVGMRRIALGIKPGQAGPGQ